LPASEIDTGSIFNTEEVAFKIAMPSLRHWYDNVPVSGDEAVTENVTD
jgi:hypothetical protein